MLIFLRLLYVLLIYLWSYIAVVFELIWRFEWKLEKHIIYKNECDANRPIAKGKNLFHWALDKHGKYSMYESVYEELNGSCF